MIGSSKPKQHPYRIFVGRIPFDAKEKVIYKYFSRFGSISSVSIKHERGSGMSKGYGFLNCADEATYNTILSKKVHRIRGSTVDCGPAYAPLKTKHLPPIEKRKIFIKKMAGNLKNEDLVQYFSRFGKVAQAYYLMKSVPGSHHVNRKIGYVEFFSP